MTRILIALIALVTFSLVASAQRAQPLPFDDHTGFKQIFDGKTLTSWDGDPAYWSVVNGVLTGETTAANPLKENTFVIWTGGVPKDFELKVEYRINATNSGIQIRSQRLPQGGNIAGFWVMKGYQADIDFANQYTGQIYEERGRGFLAMRGQMAYVTSDGVVQILGALQRSADDIKATIKPTDWNQVHIIARGNTIVQILNGQVSSVLIDDDPKGRALGGLIGFQIHVGQPMKVEFRNVWLKTL